MASEPVKDISSVSAAPADEGGWRQSPRVRLLVVSFLSLYVELLLIRWIPSTLHVVAFFNNLILIACFLGLGVGMVRPRPLADSAWQAMFRLTALVILLVSVHIFNPQVQVSATSDYDINEVTQGGIPLPAVLLGIFALAVWATVPLGQMVAVCFDQLERIPAYSINILGSLAGVLGFAAMSWLQLPPLAWSAIALAALLFVDSRLRYLLASLVLAGGLLLQHWQSSHHLENQVLWSPYYKIIVQPLVPPGLEAGFRMQVNDQFLLSGLDLRPETDYTKLGVPKEGAEHIAIFKSYYKFPFQLRQAKRVLILGAGVGNDVATALRSGVEHVTAVEIDPLVIEMGASHPEKPYANPKVEIVCNDARAFLNRTDQKFDLIIFATLDAHGLISSVGNIRLDSFVYTQQSIEAAKRLLTPDGLLVLSFGPFREETQYRQYMTVRSVFGRDPLYFLHKNDHRTIVAGNLEGVSAGKLPADWRRIEAAEIQAKLAQYPQASIPATDDWPHLYIREKRVPTEYLSILGGILLVSVLLVGFTFRKAYAPDGHFFFLGAGFLLMETKSVTEFALLIGATWQVNVLVFSVILVMILLANLLVLTVLPRVPLIPCYVLLASCLVASYLWPVGTWASGSDTMVFVLAAGYLGLPIFLAALIFATTFRTTALGSAALASNIIGAVLGGTAEYLSLAWGIRSLSLLALAMYLASLVCYMLRRRPA